MFRPLELFIGLRYTRAKRRNQFISFISAVSIVCISISVIALITVMSVMNGFDYQMKTRILGAISHATISGIGQSIEDWPRALKIAEANPHVKGAAPYVEIQALLQGRAPAAAMVRGIDPALEPKVVDIGQHMVRGKLDALTPGSWNIVLGQDLATQLGVNVGDQVVMAVPEFRATPFGGVPRMRGFHVVGTFAMGMEQFDSGLALVNIQDAEKLNSLSGPSGIRLKLDDLFNARPVAHELADRLGQVYQVQTWEQTNANLFSAISMEKKVMGVILSLIILVAVINLVSMLMMLVTDKQADIAILRTLGASPRSVMLVFFVQGAAAGVAGTLGGVLVGLLIAYKIPVIVPFIEHVLHTSFLPASVYLIDHMPSDPQASDIIPISLWTLLLAFLATLYPSWRASRVRPAEALRYE